MFLGSQVVLNVSYLIISISSEMCVIILLFVDEDIKAVLINLYREHNEEVSKWSLEFKTRFLKPNRLTF